jgi:hypothetical protein
LAFQDDYDTAKRVHMVLWRYAAAMLMPKANPLACHTKPSSVVQGFTPAALERVIGSDIGLAIWRRRARLDLEFLAATMSARHSLMWSVTDAPEKAARRVCQDLKRFHWPLYTDMRRLANRFSLIVNSPFVRLRFEFVSDDSCRKFHVDAVGLRLLCTYFGAGTEWVIGDVVHRMAPMDVAIFKGTAFPDLGPRIWHRSPPLSTGMFAGQSRLVFCIDAVS